MSEREYVYVVNSGYPHQPSPEEYIYVVNSGEPDPPSAEKTVFVVNRMGSGKPSNYKYVHVVNDGAAWRPFITSSYNVFVENLEDLPVNIRVAWGILRCPRCNGKLTAFINDYGCDFCKISFSGWELESL